MFSYPWTDRHPILTDFATNNKDLIKKITPYKIKKSRKYIDFIKKELKKSGLPEELFILAAIESGFQEEAVSGAGAVGMWQFREGTAKDLGLIVNEKVDERLDWKKSTKAAVKYLNWMSENYFDGDFEMALISYNAGVGRVSRLLKKENIRDPWILISVKDLLPKESREFLPKFITYMNYFHYLENKNIELKK